MRQLKRIPFTKEGLEAVERELEELKRSRPEAVAKLAEARAMGDLSENGLYTAAKGRLRSMDSRIFQLGMQIKLAEIVEGSNSDMVSLGSAIEVEQSGSRITFYIVGDLEANPRERKITQFSPLGKAFIGKKAGEEAIVYTPSGKNVYKILKIQ